MTNQVKNVTLPCDYSKNGLEDDLDLINDNFIITNDMTPQKKHLNINEDPYNI
jgi:hypothetical protein